MKRLAKASTLILIALFLFVGCNDDDGGGAQAVSNSDTDPPVNLSVESFSASVESFSALSDSPTDPPDPIQTPEPITLLLVGSGLLGLAGFRKRFRR